MNKKLSYLTIVLLTTACSSGALAQDDLLSAMCNRAVRMWFVSGDLATAERACQAAILEGEKEDPPGERLAYPLMKLGALYGMMGLNEPERNDQALALFERALTVREAMHGPSHPSVGKVLEGIAGAMASQGRTAEAEALYGRVVKIYEDSYGPESLELAGALSGHAAVLQLLKREEEANELIRRAKPIYDRAKQPGNLVIPSE